MTDIEELVRAALRSAPPSKRSGVGAQLGEGTAVSDAVYRLLAAEGSDTVLVSTGTDVEKRRAGGTDIGSNAVFDSGVGQAVALPNGDVVATTLGTEDGHVQPGLWLARARADGALCPTCLHRLVSDVSIVSLGVNPAGGVDFVLDDGTAEHWQP